MGLSVRALAQVELCEFEVAGLGDFQVDRRARDDRDAMAGALNHGGFVRTHESIGVGLSKCALEQSETEALGRLRVDDELAGDGGGDDGAVGGALHLLDGVHGGHPHDGRAVLDDGVDGAVDGCGVNEGADGIVYQDDVVGLGRKGGEGVGDGFLTMIAAFHDLDPPGKAVFGDLVVDPLHLRLADGYADAGDAGHGGEGAQGVNEDGDAPQREELLGLRTGHASSQAGRREDSKDLHRAAVYMVGRRG